MRVLVPIKSAEIVSICLVWVVKPNCREPQKLQQTQGSIRCFAVAKAGSALLGCGPVDSTGVWVLLS